LTLRTGLSELEDARTLAGSDEAARQRIRQALRRYMTEQKIGVPALRARIINADKPRHREIPLSTLQRFLAGSHQTQDMYVSVCRDFASVLPWYGEGLDTELFANAAFGFYGDQVAGEDQLKLMRELLESCAGSFDVAMGPQGGGLRFGLSGNPHRSQIGFTPVPDKPYLLAREFEPDIRTDPAEGRKRRFSFEGVLLLRNPIVLILLRTAAARLPVTYVLQVPEKREDTASMGEFFGHRIAVSPRVEEVPMFVPINLVKLFRQAASGEHHE
jgi:hypothetical protein